jgi:hypothetical protein
LPRSEIASTNNDERWSKEKWDSFLMGNPISPPNDETMDSSDIRLYAKLACNYQLTNKASLFHNMDVYYRSLLRDPFEVIPLTFHIKNGGTSDSEYQRFLACFNEYACNAAGNNSSTAK